MQTQTQFELPGSNPFKLDGPVLAGSGVPLPQFRVGTAISLGDAGAEYIYCAITLGGVTTLKDGQLYVLDKDFNVTLLSTANSPRGNSVVVGRVNQAAVAAGSYYGWFQRSGNAPVVSTGNANAIAETTATAGQANYNNAPTVGSKQIVGLYLFAANAAFTGDTTNGSAVLRNCSSLADIALGATIAGAGIPGATTVSAIDRTNGLVTMSANATATAATVAVTATGVLTANVLWPYIDKTN